MYAPTVRERDKYQSQAPQKKIYLHKDQIFALDVKGQVEEAFKYCRSHDSIPDDPGNPSVMFMDSGYIALELGKKATILRINHGPIFGSDIYVYVGDDFDSLKPRFTIKPGETYADAIDDVSASGKVIVFYGKNGTMPYVEFVTEKAVKAMPNSAYQHPRANPIDLVKIIEPMREKNHDMAITQKSVFVKHVIIVSEKKVLAEEGKVRLSPALANGSPISYDDTIMTCSRWGHNPDILVKADNPELAAFLLARYGKNKNFRYNKSKDKYHIDQDFKYVNNMGLEFQNKNKVGMGLAASVGLWPKDRIDSPDKYCKAMDQLMQQCRAVDIATPVLSIPMAPNKNIFYFVYRYYRKFWADKLVVEIKNMAEARMLQEFLHTVHHYTPSLDIEIIINFDLDPCKWMSCLCFAGYHRVSNVIFTNYERLFEKVQQKWETIFEPNDLFVAVSDWIETIKTLNLTFYEPGSVVDRAIFSQPAAYEHIEQYMINWLSDYSSVKVFERMLTMPHTYQIK